MATWPVDDKVVSLKRRVIKPSNRKISSSGYPMSFPKGTIMKRGFKVNMAYITYAEMGEIETFFDTNQGYTIDLNSPDPNDSTVYHVIFDQDELEFTYVNVFPEGEYTLEVDVLEV